jgi:serine/threonine protein kinase
MPKVSSLKTKADYRGPASKGKFNTTDVQIDWEGTVLHHKEGIFPKKLAFKDVVGFHVGAEPGGKPDKFGRLKILHIIKLHEMTHGKKELREFAFHPDIFENWLYWIIRSLVKHSELFLSKELIKQTPLSDKHKLKMKGVVNLSVFDRSHQIFLDALNTVQNPDKVNKLPSSPLSRGEGGTSFGKLGKKLGSGGSGTSIYPIMKLLKPIIVNEEEQRREEPVVVKFFGFDVNNLANQETVAELVKEARVLALLGKHPNIVGLVDASLAEKGMCLFMEMGKGNLRDQIQKSLSIQGELSSRDVLGFAQDILGGIAHMHKYRVYHLDMKPENVIICGGEGKSDIGKIIDFGLSRSATLQAKSQRFEAPGHWAVQGTNGYINPEAWEWAGNDVTREIDLAKRDSFAVGMTIINGLLGPFLGENEVTVNFGEQRQHVLSRINTWKDRLRKKINRDRLQDEGLSDLADAAIGLIEENPDARLSVQDALRLIWKNADIVKKKGMFEIKKI